MHWCGLSDARHEPLSFPEPVTYYRISPDNAESITGEDLRDEGFPFCFVRYIHTLYFLLPDCSEARIHGDQAA